MSILRKLRQKKGLPIVELAYHAGLDDGTLSKCERGFRRFPEKTREKIAAFFEVKQEELFDDKGFAKKQ